MPEIWLQNVKTVKKILGGQRNSAERLLWIHKILCTSLWVDLLCYNPLNSEGIMQKSCREKCTGTLSLSMLYVCKVREPIKKTLQCLFCSRDWEQCFLSPTRYHRSFWYFSRGAWAHEVLLWSYYFPQTGRYQGPRLYSTLLGTCCCYGCCPDPMNIFGALEVSMSKILVQILLLCI